MSQVLKKKKWTDDDLRKAGFQHYPRRKEIVFVRTLSPQDAPLQIKTDWGDTLVAEAGYKICYRPDKVLRDNIDDYDHWPVAPEIFSATYQPFDSDAKTPIMLHMIAKGCQPFYKVAGVWAKMLDEDVYIQSMEHKKPILVEKERFLAIGVDGEPYHMGEMTFHERYDADANTNPLTRLYNRVLDFFKNIDI